jgi:hypothetical protein
MEKRKIALKLLIKISMGAKWSKKANFDSKSTVTNVLPNTQNSIIVTEKHVLPLSTGYQTTL